MISGQRYPIGQCVFIILLPFQIECFHALCWLLWRRLSDFHPSKEDPDASYIFVPIANQHVRRSLSLSLFVKSLRGLD